MTDHRPLPGTVAQPDWFSYDPVGDIITIDGYQFTRSLFSQFTTSPIGVRFRVISRDGKITVSTERDPLEAAAPDMLAALKAINHTLHVHGKADASTPLHLRIEAAIAKATP